MEWGAAAGELELELGLRMLKGLPIYSRFTWMNTEL